MVIRDAGKRTILFEISVIEKLIKEAEEKKNREKSKATTLKA